jgi:glycerol-3-phosphate dehydrogenase (NAD+)
VGVGVGRYLPGVKLPANVVAVADPVAAVQGATVLVFVLPHQFVVGLCAQLRGHLGPGCRAISLIKVPS